MVSPSATSSSKAPPLSYADRAKKGQNIKPPNQPQPNQPAAKPSNILTNSASANSSGTEPSTTPSKPMNADDAQNPSASPSRPQAAPASPPASASDPSAPKGMNGDTPAAPEAPPVNAAPAAATASTPLKPVVNVWSLRKEQMAQQAAARSQSSTQPPPPLATSIPSTSQRPNTSKSPLPASQNAGPQISSRVTPLQPTDASHPKPRTKPQINGANTDIDEEDDPFVVKMSPNVSRRPLSSAPPPAAVDAESWPEVGKSLSNTTTHQHQRSPSNEQSSSQKAAGDSSESLQSPSTRKSALLSAFRFYTLFLDPMFNFLRLHSDREIFLILALTTLQLLSIFVGLYR